MDGPVCHVCLTPLAYHEGGVECAEAAAVVYVAVMKDRYGSSRYLLAPHSSRAVARVEGKRMGSIGTLATFLGTRAVPLEPDSEGTP